MRTGFIPILLAAAVLPALSQTQAPTIPPLPKDPHAMFEAAAPFYDFTDPSMKPWHLKATYRLYDEKGNATEQGTYEYWWASPSVHRSSWTRPSAAHTDWHISESQRAYLATGESLNFFEYKLQTAWFSPLPSAEELNEQGVRLQVEERKLFVNGDKSPCIMVVPDMPAQNALLQPAPMGLFPTYCFDPGRPILRAETSFGTLAMQFNDFVGVQGRFLPRKIDIFEGRRPILSAKVDAVTFISPSDPAFTPAPEAKVARIPMTKTPDGKAIPVKNVAVSAGVAVGMLISKVQPEYPREAKDAHITGTVVLKALIGRDGSIEDLRVVQAPAASLAVSALLAVSRWRYRPYLLNGEPVDVDTTINVIYSMGG
ncbi:MAG TPA: energy transducer TonB [Terracidiphilus sp.]|nr:energy transducer TonB [Terracidiphilus sp.]HUB50969.1 energy transducer TonB [Terracidiphilus sp.]